MKNLLLHQVLAFLLSWSVIPYCSAQQEEEQVPTNVEIFRKGISVLTDSILGKVSPMPGSTIITEVTTSEGKEVIEQAIVSQLRARGFQASLDSSDSHASSRLQTMSVELKTHYGETFDRSVVGEGKTCRTISVVLPYIFRRTDSGGNLESETLTYRYADTISTAMIPAIEQQEFHPSVAPPPDTDVFTRVLESLLLIGAAGIAIFLFFHVRS